MNMNRFFHKGQKDSKMKLSAKKLEEDEEPVLRVPIKKKKNTINQVLKPIPKKEPSDDELSIGNQSDDEISIGEPEFDDVSEEEGDIFDFESDIIEEKPKKQTKKPKEKQPKEKNSKSSIDVLDMAKATLDKIPNVALSTIPKSKVVTTSSRMTEQYIDSLERPLPEETYSIDEFDLTTESFKGSLINEVELEGVEIEKKNYFNVISSIYEYLENFEAIKANTTINVQNGEKAGKGFVYFEDLDISVQYVNADRSLKEIFEQILGNGMRLKMDISTKEKRYIFVNE